jgi:hypothetical protein
MNPALRDILADDIGVLTTGDGRMGIKKAGNPSNKTTKKYFM